MNASNTISRPPADYHQGSGRAVKYLRVLFVEDNNLVRDTICSILIEKGWGCQSFADGKQALKWLDSCTESIDILITDHRMPGMNGLEFLRKVRATAFTGKILVYSTMLHDEEQAAYEGLEADAIILKTGNPENLVKAIEAFGTQLNFSWPTCKT